MVVLIMVNKAYVVLWPPLPGRFAIGIFYPTVWLSDAIPGEKFTDCVLSAFALDPDSSTPHRNLSEKYWR